MFPIAQDKLLICEIADYWAREIQPPASFAELEVLLEKAWWRGELSVSGPPVRLQVLRFLYSTCSDEIVFVIADDAGPSEIQELANGGCLVGVPPRVPP